jgi:hypothetical protein
VLTEHSTKFDRLSKSKTVENLFNIIPPEQREDLVSFLIRNILKERQTERRWFADQIVILFRRHQRSFEQMSVVEECLRFFCKYGFFELEPLDKADRIMLREKLFSLLSILITVTTRTWPAFCISSIEKFEGEAGMKVLKLDSKIKRIRKKGVKTMKKLGSIVFWCYLKTDD